MSASITVRKVENAHDFQAFFEFPWRVYENDPNWVPPLLSMRRELLDKQKNPAWEYMEGDYFAAWRGDQIVGTITAHINHRHNEFHQEHIGWFGAFELVDDQETANALLNTAAEWVRSRGYDAIRGPQTFTTHEECGILVDGFTRNVLLMPYNFPYYQALVENAGFVKSMDLYSFHMDRAKSGDSGLTDRLRRITESVMKRNHITIRPIDRKRLKEEFGLFKELYNMAWDKNWGFVPMTPRELDNMVESLGQFFDPDFAFFAYIDGEAVGFVLGVPDFNQVLQKASPRPGVPEIFSLLRAGWYWKVKPVMDWVRIPLLGVKEAYRMKGVDVALYMTILQACLDSPRINHADGGWILEANEPMVKVAHNMGLEVYKTHRLYEKRFST